MKGLESILGEKINNTNIEFDDSKKNRTVWNGLNVSVNHSMISEVKKNIENFFEHLKTSYVNTNNELPDQVVEIKSAPQGEMATGEAGDIDDDNDWVMVSEPFDDKVLLKNLEVISKKISQIDGEPEQTDFIHKAVNKYIYFGCDSALEEVKSKLSQPALDRYGDFLKDSDTQAILASLHKNYLDHKVVGQLHNEFKENLSIDRAPQLDSHTGTITCSYEDFSVARGLLNSYYPQLTRLSLSSDEEMQITRLLQMIMCGTEKVFDLPSPKDPFCFNFKEVGPSSEPMSPNIKKGISALQHYASLAKRAHKVFHPEHIKEAAKLFTVDNIKRKSAIFSCGDISAADDYFENIKNALMRYLLANPNQIPEMVEDCVLSDITPKALTAASLEDESFSVNTLKRLLAEAPVLEADELDGLVKHCRFSAEELDELIEKTGCAKEQLASLLPSKILEIMLLMNQSFLAEASEMVQTPIIERNYNFNALHIPKTIYRYTDGMDGLVVEDVYQINLLSAGFEDENVGPQKTDQLSMARLKAVVSIPSVRATEDHAIEKHMQDVRFNWRATRGCVETLSDIIPAKKESPSPSLFSLSQSVFGLFSSISFKPDLSPTSLTQL